MEVARLNDKNLVFINWRFSCLGEGGMWKQRNCPSQQVPFSPSPLLNLSCILSHWLLWVTDGRSAFQAHFQQCCRAWLGPLCISWLFSDHCSHWISNCRHWLQHLLSLVHRVLGGSCSRFRGSFLHCKQLVFYRDVISISKQQGLKWSHWHWEHKHQTNW